MAIEHDFPCGSISLGPPGAGGIEQKYGLCPLLASRSGPKDTPVNWIPSLAAFDRSDLTGVKRRP